MTTVHDVMNRIYRTMLEPPSYQPIRCWLANTVNDTTDEVIQVSNFSVAEDQQLLRNGIIVEIGNELCVVKNIDSVGILTPSLTVERAVYGTTKAAYTPGTEVRLSPMFSRQSVFEAVRDNIITLHPQLFTLDVIHVVQVDANVFPCIDNLAISVDSAWPFEGHSQVSITTRIVDYHPRTGGRAFISSGYIGDLWIRYRKRMGVATDTADTLDELGVDDTWINIVMAGAAADLIVGRDVPNTLIDWASRTIEPEVVPVGTRGSLATRLRKYRDYLIEKASQEMTAEYAPVVERHSPFSQIGRV